MSTEQKTEMTMLEAINLALDDAMAADGEVILLGEDVADRQGGGVLGITRGLSSNYGDARVRSTPIAEQAIMGAAIGAAIVGLRPVAEIMLMNFTTVAMDMIVNHAAKLRFMSGGQTHVPLTIRTMTGAGVGNGGQHSDYLEAWFAHTPGMKVVAPSCPADAYGLLRACIEDEDPCLFIENIQSYYSKGPAPERGERIPLGRAKVLRAGADLTLISYSRLVNDCVVVADRLAREGVDVELLDLRTIEPFDSEAILASVRKTGRAVIVHEAVRKYGVGAEIAALLHESLHGVLKAPVVRVGAPQCPVPFSKPLETAFIPQQADIEAAVRSALSGSRQAVAAGT